jgi:choice-of-anchor B domain-containing protein
MGMVLIALQSTASAKTRIPEKDYARLRAARLATFGTGSGSSVETTVAAKAVVSETSAADCTGGAASGYACSRIDLLAHLPLSTFSAGNANDIWGWTDPQSGSEYALLGLDVGTAIVDLSQPGGPVYLGLLPAQTSTSAWRDVKVMGDHLYVVSEALDHGLQVFDLGQLAAVTSPPVTFTASAHFDGFGKAHNIAVNADNQSLYILGSNTCDGGLLIISALDPLSPTQAGCFDADGYTHDAQCFRYTGGDANNVGKDICVAFNEDTITIVDVSDPQAPAQISRTGYSGAEYTHQGWVTADQAYLLMGDEMDEAFYGHNSRTRIWDIADLEAPVISGIFDGPTTAIDHNLYIHEGYGYLSTYTAGLQVVSLEQVDQGILLPVAHFDTYVADDSPQMKGVFSNYPYFSSGRVIVSSVDEGLFVLQPDLSPDFEISLSSSALNVCGATTAQSMVYATGFNGYAEIVTLSAEGVPAGAELDFELNPLKASGESTLMAETSTAFAGIYPVEVVGTDGQVTRTVSADLNIFDGVPDAAALDFPGQAQTGVFVVPELRWTASVNAVTYNVEIAEDTNFSEVISVGVGIEALAYAPESALVGQTQYFWRVRAVNPCGESAFSAVRSFNTAAVSDVLLVDDDDNTPDVRGTYEAALTAAGLSYTVWDTSNSDVEPTQAWLSAFDMVVWFTGAEFGGYSGPGSVGESRLASWLDNGACLLISSQDYQYDRGVTDFMTDYLGAANVVNGGGYGNITSVGSVFSSLGEFSTAFPFTSYPDDISVAAGAVEEFTSQTGKTAGISYDGGHYRAAYWALPLEAISNSSKQAESLSLFADWCSGLQAPPPMPTPPTPTPPAPTPAPSPTPGAGTHDLFLPIVQRNS